MFKIYSKPDCSFCTKAKELLNKLEIPYEETDIEDDIAKYRDWMYKTLNVKTVPVIFNDDKFIGGYAELTDYLIEEDFI